MKDNDNIVKSTLESPDEIRQSKIDKMFFFIIKDLIELVKPLEKEGFLITAYPTDKVKEGNIIWVK
ncbi:MAG: hypothetical protein N2511_06010 [Thermodesulfovibrionales bacterium]|nr:hypothetical protein [Thermodesulfovibrionales bacterium]